jgi:4-hydroxymandelate oxidase
MVQSTMATQSLEEVAAAAPDATQWFQLYLIRDRGWTAELLGRARDSGFKAIVLTVDLPVLGRRLRDERNGFGLPPHLTLAHNPPLAELSQAGTVPGSAATEYIRVAGDPAMALDDIAWVRETSGLPVVVKGVLRGDDAVACLDAGATAIGVSTHGGRQLDTVVATADVLAEVVDAVAGRAEVYVDGGIRSGTDVLKAIALGARAVLVGRPIVYGLAVAGAQGVTDVFTILESELVRAMLLCGAGTLADLTPDLIATPTR